mmetsp:Transcript_8241/g.22168  ORF Transcript_8241/g.22168 Transcript_8241/m.22168 type:complete len:495 (+) Transcript_8241:2830-4314(+)
MASIHSCLLISPSLSLSNLAKEAGKRFSSSMSCMSMLPQVHKNLTTSGSSAMDSWSSSAVMPPLSSRSINLKALDALSKNLATNSMSNGLIETTSPEALTLVGQGVSSFQASRAAINAARAGSISSSSKPLPPLASQGFGPLPSRSLSAARCASFFSKAPSTAPSHSAAPISPSHSRSAWARACPMQSGSSTVFKSGLSQPSTILTISSATESSSPPTQATCCGGACGTTDPSASCWPAMTAFAGTTVPSASVTVSDALTTLPSSNVMTAPPWTAGIVAPPCRGVPGLTLDAGTTLPSASVTTASPCLTSGIAAPPCSGVPGFTSDAGTLEPSANVTMGTAAFDFTPKPMSILDLALRAAHLLIRGLPPTFTFGAGLTVFPSGIFTVPSLAASGMVAPPCNFVPGGTLDAGTTRPSASFTVPDSLASNFAFVEAMALSQTLLSMMPSPSLSMVSKTWRAAMRKPRANSSSALAAALSLRSRSSARSSKRFARPR